MKKIRSVIGLGIVALILFAPGAVIKYSVCVTNKVANIFQNICKDKVTYMEYI